jgi:hypothetical protein
MRNRSLIIAMAALALSGGVARAQIRQIPGNNTAYGTTSAEFLLLSPTARGAALGNAFSALATDVSSLYYNPAGLSQLGHSELNVSTTSYLAGTKYTWAGISMPFASGAKAVGFSVGSFGFSGQPIYTVEDPTGASARTYSVAETYFGFTYSQQFSDRFSAGVTAKYVNDQLGDVSASAIAVDLGTSFHATIGGRAIRAAFTVQNLGSNLQHGGKGLDATVVREPPTGQVSVPQDAAPASLQAKAWPLPVQFRVALAYDAFSTPMSRLSVLGEFSQPNNNQPGFGLGAEYSVQLGTSGLELAPRMSYTYQPANSMDAPTSTDATYAGFNSTLGNGAFGLAYGGGIHYRKGTRGIGFGVDYALKNYGPLGNVNVVSFGMSW